MKQDSDIVNMVSQHKVIKFKMADKFKLFFLKRMSCCKVSTNDKGKELTRN